MQSSAKSWASTTEDDKKPIFNPENKPVKEDKNEVVYDTLAGHLFIRETTVTVDKSYVPPTVTTALEAEEHAPQANAAFQDNYKSPTRQKSGFTFVNELEKEFRLEEYERNLNVALKARGKYKGNQKQIARRLAQMKRENVGPGWYQDQSHKQIEQVNQLAGVLKADLEEGIIARTQRFLAELGIAPPVPGGAVNYCVKHCNQEPIEFLYLMHCCILDMEHASPSYKPLTNEADRTYSLNERLLLSGICQLHLPSLFKKLDTILPPPKVELPLTWPDKDPKHKIKYSSPYLEPQPITSKCWLAERQEQEDYREYLSSRRRYHKQLKHNQLHYSKEVTDTAAVSVNRSKFSEVQWSSTILSNEEQCKGEDCKYPSSTMEPCRHRKSSYFKKEREPNRNKQKMDMGEGPEVEINKIYFDSESVYHCACDGREERHWSGLAEGQSEVMQLVRPIPEDISVLFPLKSQPLRGSFSELQPGTTDSAMHSSKSKLLFFSTLPYQGLSNEERLTRQMDALLELKKLKNDIAQMPESEQLVAALQFLKRTGDAISILPEPHKIPILKRWFEVRRGIMRRLTPAVKEVLMHQSKLIWSMVEVPLSTVHVPSLGLSESALRKLTWDKRQWLRRRVEKKVTKYEREVKRAIVGKSREFWAPMLYEYRDPKSKLQKSFKRTYFTYLPAREAETYVTKVWQLGEYREIVY